MKVRPLADRILVKREEPSETVRGGIIIPDTAKEKPQQGKVVAAGPGSRKKDGERVPLDVKLDDTVLYARYAGTTIKLEGQEYLILKETELLAIVENGQQ